MDKVFLISLFLIHSSTHTNLQRTVSNVVRLVIDQSKEKFMYQPKSNVPALSGLFSSLGLAPHLVFLLLLFFGKMQAPLGFLIVTYLDLLPKN